MKRKALNALGYLVVAALYALALTASARGESVTTVPTEKPSQYIWVAADGTFTNLPVTHGAGVKQWEPSRDRITPVQVPDYRIKPTYTPTAQPTYVVESSGGEDFCREVYLGNSARGGGVTVCGTERAVIQEQRVRRRGQLTTSTDTVLTVDGVEVMRVRGRTWTHDPSATVRE